MGDEKPMSASTGAIKKKKDEKTRRRDQRSWENVVKSCNNMSEPEKMAVIQEKYTDLHNELRKVTSSQQLMERQCTVLQRERDHTQAELTKNILAKAKLESLCRELQKQNKIIKDENITRVKEEEERRREVATSFTEKLNLLTTLMDENKDKSVRLREENMSMTTKLTKLYDQFQERESHLANMNRQLELQKKLSETQIKKLEVEYQTERQVWDQERQMLLENLAKSDEANITLQANIRSLQEHLDIYKNQYSDFETTMQKSNKVFDTFKEEMAKMQKANSVLEKERNEYRARWQACTNSVVQVSEMQQQTAAELKVAERKVQMLEKLCRQLQAERTAYLQQLEENNIKPAVLPSPPPEERPPERHVVPGPSSGPSQSGSQRRLTKKEKLLVALKSELKVMEDELKIATKQQEPSTSKSVDSIQQLADPATKQQPLTSKSMSALQQLAESQTDEDKLLQPTTSKSVGALPDSSMVVECASTMSMGEVSTSDLESFISDLPSSTTLETTFMSLGAISSDTDVSVKQVRSCPEIKQKEKEADIEEASSASSVTELLTELSLDAIPLYKPDGVTDLTVQFEAESLVSETEARMNLLDDGVSSTFLTFTAPSAMAVSTTDTDTQETSSAEEIETTLATATETEHTVGTTTENEITMDTTTATEITVDTSETEGDPLSAGSVPLKESEGKTEFTKEA